MASPHGRLLVVEGLSKTFPGQKALADFSLSLAPGEVHALLGHNGSGKSTFIKVLAGYHQPDPGSRAWLAGSPFELGSRTQARNGGIRFIHQDLGLIPSLSVVDNLALGTSYEGTRWVGARRESAAAAELLAGYGIRVDPRSRVRDLAPAEQTMVAIARALRGGAATGRLLVLDEPTAALPSAEVERLFAVVRAVRDAGGCVLYVTHRLGEISEIADNLTVLRNGRVVASRPVAGLEQSEVVELIVGRAVTSGRIAGSSTTPDQRTVALRVCDVVGTSVHGVSFDVGVGEVLGIGGIVGSGREELPHLLFGSRAWRSGTLEVDGRSFSTIDPRRALAAGIAFAPAERKTQAATPSLSVADNLLLPSLPRARWTRWLSVRRGSRAARPWLGSFGVTPANPEAALATLSGGNQQRVVLARWVRCKPRVLLVDEPTQGVDVGAKADIYAILAAAAVEGMSVVVFSSDAEELAAMCDRVLVLSDGIVRSSLAGTDLTEEHVIAESVRVDKGVAV